MWWRLRCIGREAYIHSLVARTFFCTYLMHSHICNVKKVCCTCVISISCISHFMFAVPTRSHRVPVHILAQLSRLESAGHAHLRTSTEELLKTVVAPHREQLHGPVDISPSRYCCGVTPLVPVFFFWSVTTRGRSFCTHAIRRTSQISNLLHMDRRQLQRLAARLHGHLRAGRHRGTPRVHGARQVRCVRRPGGRVHEAVYRQTQFSCFCVRSIRFVSFSKFIDTRCQRNSSFQHISFLK